MKIGVLALQGGFAKHAEKLKKQDVEPILVREKKDLSSCLGLIIPGGESTTIRKQIKYANLYDAILEFARTKPVFGTCAGMILMSKSYFNLIAIECLRNAYGRQVSSFQTSVDFQETKIPAIFIRAPKILSLEDSVQVLSFDNKTPVFVRQGHHLAASFHPELSDDLSVHRYFIQMVKNA